MSDEPEIVTVPAIQDMSDEHFLKHMDNRHVFDTADERPLAEHPHRQQAWIKPYRAFHEYLHRHGEYQHEHLPPQASGIDE